jgi:hypothetical protein
MREAGGYSIFIGKVRKLEAAGNDLEGAMEGAIRRCIEEGTEGFFRGVWDGGSEHINE